MPWMLNFQDHYMFFCALALMNFFKVVGRKSQLFVATSRMGGHVLEFYMLLIARYLPLIFLLQI